MRATTAAGDSTINRRSMEPSLISGSFIRGFRAKNDRNNRQLAISMNVNSVNSMIENAY